MAVIVNLNLNRPKGCVVNNVGQLSWMMQTEKLQPSSRHKN
jgi:hypothetical protein